MILRQFPATCLFAGASLLAGCGLTEQKTESSTTTSQNQSAGAAAFISVLSRQDQAATNMVVSSFRNMETNADGMSPKSRSGFQSANEAFRTSLAENPSNTAANFGVAVTSLALRMDDFSDTLQKMWDNGLRVGDQGPSRMFQGSAVEIAEAPVVSGRALSVPENGPTIRALQDAVERSFLPTVDSVVNSLSACWNDPNFAYRFTVDGFKDSLTIGRADVGTALAAAEAVQAYLVWFISQDVEVGFDGQGFPTQYAWLDTLAHIPGTGPATASQRQALENLQTLVPATGMTSTRNFLGIRPGYQAKVNAIPAQFVSIASLMKDVANYSYSYQTDAKHGLLSLNQQQRDQAIEAADSVIRILSSPTLVTMPERTGEEYTGSDWNANTGFVYHYNMIRYPAVSIRVDVSKVITLGSRQVFLPRFAWNAAADWELKGPFSLVKGTTRTGVKELPSLKLTGPAAYEAYVEWADPSMGGLFPDFRSSHEIFAKVAEMGAKGTVIGTRDVTYPPYQTTSEPLVFGEGFLPKRFAF